VPLRSSEFLGKKSCCNSSKHKFFKPSCEGDILTVEAIRISESRKIGLYHIKITDKENKLIALFSGTAYIKV